MATGSQEKVGASEVARHVARTAARLFSEKGYDATSVRMIVEAAGVTKPTLYYHFGSKEGLAQVLLNRPLAGLLESLRAIAAEAGDPIEVLSRLFAAQFAFCREEPDRARFYYAIGFGPLASGLAEELGRVAGQLDEPLLDAIQRLATAGIVAPERSADLLLACRGVITASVMDFLYCDKIKGKHHPETNELGPELARRLVGDLLRGFGEPGYTGQG